MLSFGNMIFTILLPFLTIPCAVCCGSIGAAVTFTIWLILNFIFAIIGHLRLEDSIVILNKYIPEAKGNLDTIGKCIDLNKPIDAASFLKQLNELADDMGYLKRIHMATYIILYIAPIGVAIVASCSCFAYSLKNCFENSTDNLKE